MSRFEDIIAEFEEGPGQDESVLLADGFEEALMGIAQQFNTYFAVYDYDKCIEILKERDGMDHHEAVEFFEFNTQQAYVGPNTPAFLVYT